MSEVFRDRSFERAGFPSAQAVPDGFQPLDQVRHVASGIRTACCGAEMRAASERAGFIDQAARCCRVEEGTGWCCGKGFSSRGLECAGGDEGLALGEMRGLSGQQELATFGAERAGTLHRTECQLGVNFPDFGNGQPFTRIIAPGHAVQEEIRRKFSSRFFPTVVRMDSG